MHEYAWIHICGELMGCHTSWQVDIDMGGDYTTDNAKGLNDA